MQEMSERKTRRLLAKRCHDNSNQSADQNIFAHLGSTEPLPLLSNVCKIKGSLYDIVGPVQFKLKLIENPSIDAPPQEETARSNSLFESGLQDTTNFNTTINRQTIYSKLRKEQQNVLSKQKKQMKRYQEYKQIWGQQSQYLRNKITRQKQKQTLLQSNVKGLYVHPTQQKPCSVVNYWQASLRRRKVAKSLKDNKSRQQQQGEERQTNHGQFAKSIPVLPLKQLRLIQKKELTLSGRNRSFEETYRTSGLSTERKSKMPINQQEVFKIDYSGDVKWMRMEGL